MADYIDAPVPFIIGVTQQMWQHILRIKVIPTDIFIFNLDTK
jgi:hypothetical protein